MDKEDLFHDVMHCIERYSAVLNVPNLSQENVIMLNSLITNQILRITPSEIRYEDSIHDKFMSAETYKEYSEFKKNAKPGDIFNYNPMR